jgi:hypothetical protein
MMCFCTPSALCSKYVVKVWHAYKSLLEGISQTKNALIHVSARAGSSEIITVDDYVGFCLYQLRLPATQYMSFSVPRFCLKSNIDFNDVSKAYVE